MDDDNVEEKDEGPEVSMLEEEILEALSADGANVVTYKDVIFGQLSINLASGSLRLLSNDTKDSPLFEFEFSDMKMNFQTRPRTKSYKFDLKVGGVFLRDMVTHGSLFPLLISPQNVKDAPLSSKSHSTTSKGLSGFAKSFTNMLPLPSFAEKTSEEPALFDLLYETKPLDSKNIDFRLHVKSQPLNILYNPSVLKCMSDFFKISDEFHHVSDRIFAAALDRIEEAKQKTKIEVIRNINSLLDGNAFEKKTWDIVVDLSAPQLLIPEHFTRKEALIMVIDLGKFFLTNAVDKEGTEKDQKQVDDDDEDEEFVTPDSSPKEPSTPNSLNDNSENFQQQQQTLEALEKKMYDRFSMNMLGMQVIVARIKDNWKHAYLKGNSSLHVLDKFSISLQLERRVLFTTDPNWPSLVITGNLPKLVMHINEDKVFAIERMLRLLIKDSTDSQMSKANISTQTDDVFDGNRESDSKSDFLSDWKPKSNVDENSKLMLLQFGVSEMSVDLQSQGRNIAELQVTGVRAGFTKRPFDTNIILSVHSLLLVDALQTFGPNYELLVASHKHVMVDSISGSLKGSEPVSPMSPSSPNPYVRSYLDTMTTPTDIKDALASLQTTDPRHRATSPAVSDFSKRNYILIDPKGRPTVTSGSDHHFHTCCLSVRHHFSKFHKTKQLSSENSDCYWRDCGSGRVDH